VNKRKGFRKLEKKEVSRSGGKQITINREGLISIGKGIMTELGSEGVKESSNIEIEDNGKDTLCIIFDSKDTNNPELRINNGSGKISCKGLLRDSSLTSITTLLSSETGTPSITDKEPEVLCDKDGKMVYINTILTSLTYLDFNGNDPLSEGYM
jgi:hypothetical protein